MSTSTLGTNANNTLTSLVFGGAMNTTDLATIANSIKDDLTNGNPVWPGAWAQTGLLYVPNRGVLRMLPGDFVGVDNRGWPILLSAASAVAAGGNWTHT